MEKYFIVTNSKLGEDYFKHEENYKKVKEAFKEFTVEQGIKADLYYVDNQRVYIVPVDTDIEKFKNVLRVPLDNGLRQFKENSKIAKAWKEKLKSKELKVFGRIDVGDYFGLPFGGFRRRLFDINGVVYCSIEPREGATGKFEIPKDIIEIKASEFFKVIEDYESKKK